MITDVDIATLVKHLKSLKEKFDGISDKDIYPIRASCRKFRRIFYSTINWKEISLLKNSAVHTGNLLLIINDVLDDPKAAIEKYGDIPTIKANISDILDSLIKALTVVIDEVKVKAAAAA